MAPLMAAKIWGFTVAIANLLFVSYQLSAVSFQLKAKNLKKPKNLYIPLQGCELLSLADR
jgi:hypothetical protein